MLQCSCQMSKMECVHLWYTPVITTKRYKKAKINKKEVPERIPYHQLIQHQHLHPLKAPTTPPPGLTSWEKTHKVGATESWKGWWVELHHCLIARQTCIPIQVPKWYIWYQFKIMTCFPRVDPLLTSLPSWLKVSMVLIKRKRMFPSSKYLWFSKISEKINL